MYIKRTSHKLKAYEYQSIKIQMIKYNALSTRACVSCTDARFCCLLWQFVLASKTQTMLRWIVICNDELLCSYKAKKTRKPQLSHGVRTRRSACRKGPRGSACLPRSNSAQCSRQLGAAEERLRTATKGVEGRRNKAAQAANAAPCAATRQVAVHA